MIEILLDLLRLIFSPIDAIISVIYSLTLIPSSSNFFSRRSSTLSLSIDKVDNFLTTFWKSSFLATKSVSELISIIEAIFSTLSAAINPSDAIRPSFAALAVPFVLSQSIVLL